MKKLPFHISLLNALRGIIRILKNERNFQIEIFAFIINIFLIVFLKFSASDAALIFVVCFGVLALEIINTAIEKICDVVQPDYDERIKIIKDISAAAVLLGVFAAIIIGALVYPKYLL